MHAGCLPHLLNRRTFDCRRLYCALIADAAPLQLRHGLPEESGRLVTLDAIYLHAKGGGDARLHQRVHERPAGSLKALCAIA